MPTRTSQRSANRGPRKLPRDPHPDHARNRSCSPPSYPSFRIRRHVVAAPTGRRGAKRCRNSQRPHPEQKGTRAYPTSTPRLLTTWAVMRNGT